MKNWWKSQTADKTLRRITRNMAYLMSANVLVSLIGLVTMAVMARALGPVGLGVIALAEAFVRLVDQLVRLEPWQAVVRFGAAKLEMGETAAFGRLIKFTFFIDICGAALAAVIGITVCGIASNWLGFNAEQARLTQFYSASLFFALSSTATALLRIFDRFDILAKMSVALAIFRLGLSLIAWQLSGDVWAFIAILFFYSMAEQLLPLTLAWIELRSRGHGAFWRIPLTEVFADNPGIVRFIVNTNLNALARLSTQRLDTLIVGAILGPSAAGFYLLARRVGIAAVKFGRPLQQAIYPDIAKVWARGERLRFRQLVLHANGLLTAASIMGLVAAYFLMDSIVRIAFGTEFMAVVPLVNLQLVAVALFLSSNTLGPALMSMGADKALVTVSLIATAAFFASIVPLLNTFGAAGAVASQAIFNFILAVGSWILLLWLTRPATDVLKPPVQPS